MTNQLTLAPQEPTQGPCGATWVVTLDTGRIGDWIIVTAPTEQDATKQLTRYQRRKLKTISRSRSTHEWDAMKGA